MKELDKGDIITFSNKQEYVIAEVLDYNDQEYLMLFEKNGDMILENAKYVKTKMNSKNERSIENIKNKDELYEIIDIFLPLFEQDYIAA